MKQLFEKEDLYLLAFTILFVLLYLQIKFVVFIFLVPLFLYLKQVKEIHFEKLVITFLIGVGINFSYFNEYGKKYLVTIIILYCIFLLIFAYVAKKFISKKYLIFTIPSILFLMFYFMRFTIFNNFWMNYSAFISPQTTLIQYFGSYGMIFIIGLINILFFYLIENYKSKNKKYYTYLGIFVIIFGAVLLTPIQQISNDDDNYNTLKVAGIQANLNQTWTQRIENREINLNTYLRLTNEAIAKYNPQVVVWQEYLFTHPFELDINLQNRLHQFTIENNITLALGSITLSDEKSMNSKRYNTLYIFENGKLQTYDAYEPFPLFDQEYVKGYSNEPVYVQNNSVGFSLCYEENFPYVFTKQNIENNALAFFAIGNQYVMTNYRALKLTSLNSNLRAAENNHYVFRIETSGLSTVIDNSGHNVREVPIKSEQILFYKVPLINEKTFYAKYRIWIESLFVIISISILLFTIFQLKLFRPVKKSVKRK